MRRLILIGLLAILLPSAAVAWTREELRAAGVPEDQIPTVPDLVERTDNLGDIPTFRENGTLSWGALANLSVTYIPHGPGMTDVKYSVRQEVSDLNGKEIRIEGFIYPLAGGREHDHFLLAGLSPSCPFCLPGGPAELVEVLAKTPVTHSIEPVIITGRFHVLQNDPTGMMYRLTEAALVPAGG